MPCSYIVERASETAFLELSGGVTEDELDRFTDQLLKDRKFISTKKQLIVVGRLDEDISINYLIQTAQSEWSDEGEKIAVVVENEASYRQALMDRWTRKEWPDFIQLFSTRAEALLWLSRVPEDPASSL
jgi:hypothetical protein